jgi:transcriptional regulator with XRE-family HTH domain
MSAYIAAVPQKTLGSTIRLLREKADYGLREFAGLVGISAAYQSDIEYDRRVPTDDVLGKITKGLRRRVEVTFDELRALSPRLDPDVRDLLQQSPEVNQLLREMKQTGQPIGDVIRDLQQHLRDKHKDPRDT